MTDKTIDLAGDVERLLSPASGYEVGVDDEYDTNVGELIDRYPGTETADVGLIGVPFDTACVAGPRGSRYGPKGVRESITYGTSYNPEIDVDISSGIDIVDFGDVKVQHTDVLETHRRVEEVLTAISDCEIVPITIGGDHSLSYPTVKALMNATDGQIGVINVDAHHDVRHSHGGELSSGTPFRRALEDDSGSLSHENFVELGIAGWHNSKYYLDWVRDNGGTVITAREIHQNGVTSAARRALEIAADGTEAVFLSIDIDVLDAATAPGTSAPTPGGLESWQLLEIAYEIGKHDVVSAFDLHEVAPPLDVRDVTSMIGAAVVTQIFGAHTDAT